MRVFIPMAPLIFLVSACDRLPAEQHGFAETTVQTTLAADPALTSVYP